MSQADMVRYAGRGVALAWGAFWVWFNVASGFGESRSPGLGDLSYHLVLAGVVVLVCASTWVNDVLGALCLLLIAGAFLWRFHNPAWYGVQWMVPVLLLGPPIISAVLLLISAFQHRNHNAAAL